MHNVCNVHFEIKKKISRYFYLWPLESELAKSLVFISCLLSNSKPLCRLMLCSRKDKHLKKDQGINANTNNNVNYLIIAGFHPYFFTLHVYIFLSMYDDEILLN